MFDKEKYISKRISYEVQQELILILWNLIEEARQHTQLDYLQIFHLNRVTLDGVPAVSYTQLTLPTINIRCSSRWAADD